MFKSLKLPAGGEVGVALLIVAIISLMILPLPPAIIDILLGINITLSVTLLMVTLYVTNIVSLSAFPALLLFTTLYRLSLNIASTKSILLKADAGHIIESFGRLVVGGNLVVGLVVFVIIATVQFIVIAKGSERVAEVGARFTLDALPGKQMSIDADLRANLLTADEARRKRALLAIESQLHGGMDGAMKFVKGDAIAGLVITLINIVAGIAVGVVYHGMTTGEAANRFSVLSIGDAMVSQIPSLLLSVAAGVMTTRVVDESQPRAGSLGDDIGRQLTSNSRALYFTAVLLLGFAAVPGFPSLLFVMLAAILAIAAYHLNAKHPHSAPGTESDALQSMQRPGAKSEMPAILTSAPPFACPIGIRLSPDVVPRLAMPALERAFALERARLQQELGLPFPGIAMWPHAALPEATGEILVHDVPKLKIDLPSGKVMLPEPERCAPYHPLSATNDATPPAPNAETFGPIDATGAPTRWADERAAPPKAEVWRIERVIAHAAIAMIRHHAPQFLGVQETQWILDQAAVDYPGLVAEVQKVLAPQRIAEVFRRLLEEQVPIRNVRSIMESLIQWGPKEKDLLMLTEYVRGDMSHLLAHQAANGEPALCAVLFDLPVEQHIRQSIKQTPTGNYLALPPDEINILVNKVESLIHDSPRNRIAVVTSMDIRRYVRRMIETRLPWLSVYSYQELGEQIELKPLGRVTI
ncbi:hypersensitivity response secretion protein hrcV [Burkholderia singularis]|uniref:Hypersensitivity response secretion protein hrcV n=1 Tax=Burkholderia singularis TaxID=1503053 RepID=A0A103DWW8_9BURK|nr:type III secretion system export apparatus subunit SctV [Burkholderia singularis]KVE24195.1 hypersensitivity response secretion protein hrcV [Burkholderia singularis]